MSIRGWVYIISNKSMPELLKVGFSTKDPQLRAKELANTGSPHNYEVEYDALVLNPRAVEQRVHQALSDKHEGKEWFRCDINEAIKEIRVLFGDEILIENTKYQQLKEAEGKTKEPESSNIYGNCWYHNCNELAKTEFQNHYYCIEHHELLRKQYMATSVTQRKKNREYSVKRLREETTRKPNPDAISIKDIWKRNYKK